MAQSFQASQRLLITLTRTSRYYQARPSLLSNHFRNHSGIAVSARPATIGFSVSFADGPLENIITKPSDSNPEPPEGPKASTKKDMGLRQANVRRRKPQSVSAKHDRIEAATPDSVSHPKATPAKKVTAKKRTTTKAKGGKDTAKDAKQEIEAASRPGQTAWHEVDELEIEESVDEDEEEQHLQRDYPDTRTIHEAGRVAHAQQGENSIKSEPEGSGRSPRPLSTYKETWQVQKAVLKNKFAEGWNPRKKLSPDTMEGIRALHAQYPDRYTTPVLAEQFAVSSEAIRRILKSKWGNNLEPEKAAEIKERWAKRHDRIWDIKSQIGLRPKRKGAKEVEDPDQFEEELRGRQLLEAHRNA